MKNHFRATGYYEPEDISFIIDSNGKFDEVWKLSALLLRKGCKLIDIVEVDNKAIEINIEPPAVDKTNLIIRAVAKGKPQFLPVSHNGIRYNAIQVDNKMYSPDKYKPAK